jgi:hypothetical protein
VRNSGLAVAVLLALAGRAGRMDAQLNDTCYPSKSSNEARTMAIFDVPLAFSGAGAPAAGPVGRLHLGLEVTYLPNVDPSTATPTTCRPNKQRPEHTDLLFAAPRPRASVSLPAGFAVEASWIPPIRMSDVKANLVGVALSWTKELRQVVLELRSHGSFGVIRAPITCDDSALQDAGSPCYQGQRSNDAFHPNVAGLSAAVGWSLGQIHPYLGAGYNHLAPRFQVNFTDQFEVVDRRRVIVDLDRGVLFGGATWNALRRVDLSAEIYSAPVDAVTARVTARVRLR